MSRARIGLDLDGVVYNWDATVRYLLKSHHGIELPGVTTEWEFIPQNVSEDVWRWLWTEGVRLGLFRYGHLHRGAIEGVHALAKLADIEVVTHRPESAVQDTLRFLAYLELPLAGVHILTARQPKSSVGCDVYIDDAPHVIEDVTDAGHRAVLVERPWNNRPNTAPDRPYVRGYDWTESDMGRPSIVTAAAIQLGRRA